MTSHHRGPKPKLRAAYRAPSQNRTFSLSLSSVTEDIFHRRVRHRALSLRCACIRSSGIGYLCANFSFCRGLYCRANPTEKNRVLYTHSITYPALKMPSEPSFRIGIIYLSPAHTVLHHRHTERPIEIHTMDGVARLCTRKRTGLIALRMMLAAW